MEAATTDGSECGPSRDIHRHHIAPSSSSTSTTNAKTSTQPLHKPILMFEQLSAATWRIFLRLGAAYEADIFSILRGSPSIIRSFEFALADGAIDCTVEYPDEMNYAERFCDVTQHLRVGLESRGELESELRSLVLFDIKSTVAEEAQHQAYIITRAQRRRVAFTIGIAAADPTFVDVIPNYAQEEQALSSEATVADETSEVIANVARRARLAPAAYGGLDQCGSPFRMPIALLRVAISRIRKLARGEILVYENPWTRAQFRGWRPKMTTSSIWLFPKHTHPQYSACRAVVEVVRRQSATLKMGLRSDFVGLQPQLADLKLILKHRQWFVQMKMDNTLRAKHSRPHRVPIASRDDGMPESQFFSTYDRYRSQHCHFVPCC